jgi:hypothetical protein
VTVEVEGRAQRFAQRVAELRIEDPAPGRHGLWLRVGAIVMLAGLGTCILAVTRSQGTSDPLDQRDALALGLAGIATTIVGAAVYLRYAVTKVLRFWLARMSYDLQEHADRMAGDR